MINLSDIDLSTLTDEQLSKHINELEDEVSTLHATEQALKILANSKQICCHTE